MKKYFLFVLIALMGIVLVSCENGSSQGKNPYPYLRLSDIAPLHLVTISKAEEKLTELGFKFAKMEYDTYVYSSEDKLDTIYLSPNADRLIYGVTYYSRKHVSPVEASGWLGHIPEIIKLPNYSKSIPFYQADIYSTDRVEIKNYSDYLEKIKNGYESISAWWMVNEYDTENQVCISYDGTLGLAYLLIYADN